MLCNDYFFDDPTCNAKDSRQLYRMNKELFRKIVHVGRAYDDYFMLKMYCTRIVGFLSIQKCAAAMRMIAYGTSRDARDE
jgi:hypothetical protein